MVTATKSAVEQILDTISIEAGNWKQAQAKLMTRKLLTKLENTGMDHTELALAGHFYYDGCLDVLKLEN